MYETETIILHYPLYETVSKRLNLHFNA